MGLDRDLIGQLRHLLRPIATRVANSIARAVVQLADDSKKLQLVQLGVLAGETIDDGERFAEYGFTSVPLPGAEAVVVFPNGDRAHPLVIAVDDRRHRPTGEAPGTVIMYGHAGQRIRCLPDGNIEVHPKPGGRVEINDEGAAGLAATDELVHGTGIDPFTGSTYKVLGSTAASVRAKK